MTIVITYDDGTVETYSSCTGYSRDATSVSFNGKLSGDTDAKDHVINWAKVKKLSK